MKSRRKGQGLIEYAIILALIGVVSGLTLKASGTTINDVYCDVVTGLGADGGSCGGSLFHDAFDGDMLSAWEVVKGKWYPEDGKLCGGPGEGQIYTDVGASDYVINLSGATLEKGDGFGIFFRADNYKKVDGYSFQFDPGYGSGEFILREWAHGREFSPFARQKPSGSFDWHEVVHDVRLEVSGDTFTVYVDDELVVQGSDSTYTEGGVGLRTWDGTKVCFDSIDIDPIP